MTENRVRIDYELLNDRREKFAVVVEPLLHSNIPGEVSLRVTHNGLQWSTITLLPEERLPVIRALLLYDEQQAMFAQVQRQAGPQ